jgi:hypothetical protein
MVDRERTLRTRLSTRVTRHDASRTHLGIRADGVVQAGPSGVPGVVAVAIGRPRSLLSILCVVRHGRIKIARRRIGERREEAGGEAGTRPQGI